MKVLKQNYLGLDHEAVAKHYEGDLIFVNDLCIDIMGLGRTAAAVYLARNPNTSKEHKKYMLIFQASDPVLFRPTLMITGRTQEEMDKERHHRGVRCVKCDTVLVSVHRHNQVFCGCINQAMADGGKDYVRSGAKDMNLIEFVDVDLLTDEVT